MGIEGGVERTIANSNAVALLSFAKSLVGFKHVEGIVTSDKDKFLEMEFIDGYMGIIKSDVRHTASTIPALLREMLPFRPPVQNDMDGLTDYAFTFSQRLLRHKRTPTGNPFNRIAWMRVVGGDLTRDYVRLFSVVGLQEPTMWKREAFLKLAVFSMVLSDFIGEGGISRLRQRVSLVRNMLVKGLVSIDAEHIRSDASTFSPLAFESVARAFALALVIENLPDSDKVYIQNVITFAPM
jgi:hypothetical protein